MKLRTLEILAKKVPDKRPEVLLPEPWGSPTSAFGHSYEALERCLSNLRQLSESANSDGLPVDALIGG